MNCLEKTEKKNEQNGESDAIKQHMSIAVQLKDLSMPVALLNIRDGIG